MKRLATFTAAAMMMILAPTSADAIPDKTTLVSWYPSNALKWQIKILAPIGWRPFAYHFCQDATGDKIVWLINRHYHYYVVERCVLTLDGYYRSTIRYWYVY